MKEISLDTEYTGQEIMDWIAKNPKHPISIALLRRYYYVDPEWYDVKSLNPNRKYKIRDYTTLWVDTWGSYNRTTYKVEKVPTVQPRRSSLKKGI